MAEDPGFTVAELYEGADGLTLLLRTPSVGAVARLQEMFTRLAQNPGLRLDLSVEIGTEIGGVGEAVVECDERVGDFLKAIHVRRERETHSPNFVWRRGPGGWEWCAELMQPLIDSGGRPGHQYLSQGGGDDAEVEVDLVAE